jgi:hypothetical protein
LIFSLRSLDITSSHSQSHFCVVQHDDVCLCQQKTLVYAGTMASHAD